MIQSAAKTPSLTTPSSKALSLNRDLFRQASVLIGCVVLFAIFSLLTSSFYQPSNLIDIMLQSSINAVIAVGMTLVIITRGIDLSVGSMVGLSSMVASDLMSHNMALGIFGGLAVGMICGLINGVLIAKLKLPDFIVTLGTLSVYRGAALIYTNGQPIYGLPEGFRAAFGGQLLGVPTPVIMAFIVAGLAFFLVRFTALGEQIIGPAFQPRGVCAHRADRRCRADRRKRLRAPGDRRRGYRRRKPVRGRWKSAWLAYRRADIGRFTERTDAYERPVVLAICGLGRGRHPCGLCGSTRPSASMREWVRLSRAA